MGGIDWLCVALGIKPGAFLSGLIGGVFSLRWVPEVGWSGRLTTILFGGITANYGTEPLYTSLGIHGLHMGAIGLMIGLFAMSLAAAIFKALNEIKLAEVIADGARGILNRVIGKGGAS